MAGRNANASEAIEQRGAGIGQRAAELGGGGSARRQRAAAPQGRQASEAPAARGGDQEAGLPVTDRQYEPTQQVGEPVAEYVTTEPVGQVAEQPDVRTAEAEQPRRVRSMAEMSRLVDSELSRLPSQPAYPKVPTPAEGAPQETMDMVERIAARDTPMAQTGSAPGPVYTPGQIAAMRGIERRRREEAARAEAEASGASEETVEQAVEQARERAVEEERGRHVSPERRERMEAARQGAPDPTRSKPGILDRAIGRLPRVPGRRNTENMPTTRPAGIVNTLMKQISRSFGTHGVGFRIYGKMVPDSSLGYRDVGIGMQELRAVVEQNAEMLDELIAMSLPEGTDFTSCRMMRLGDLADLINTSDVRGEVAGLDELASIGSYGTTRGIEVFTAKPPNNRGQDVQRRVLKIMTGSPRGIFLHPYMAAMYTADFDGDDMEISFDPKVRFGARDPMDHMVGIDGAQSFDMAFIPLCQLENGDHDRAKMYVNGVMLSRWTDWQYEEGTSDYTLDCYEELLESVVAISDTANLTTGDAEDRQARAYGDMFRAARKWADSIYGGRGEKYRSDALMADVTDAIISGFRNIKIINSLRVAGVESEEAVIHEGEPDPGNPYDYALRQVLDGMVSGATPNNFQELKVMMNGFLGNVENKNAPFRFTADVGKMMKLDKRYKIGSEYVIDQDDDAAMTDFLQKTLKYKYSKRMTVDVKTAGRSMYFTEVLRNYVIRDVGMPDDIWTMRDENGNVVRRKRTFNEFIRQFVNAYNKHSMVINQANLVWLSNMGIASNSNRKTVNPIENAKRLDRITMKDIATPFIDVYGRFSVDRMFHGLYEPFEDDPNIERGDKNVSFTRDLRTRSNFVMLKSRYMRMDIKSFSVNNMIYLGEDSNKIDTHLAWDTRKKDANGRSVYSYESDGRVAMGLIAAIADKRTSTKSEFNKNVFGMYESMNGKRDSVSLTGRGGANTVVANVCDLLMDIRRRDSEGRLIQPLPTMGMPGYYAGIGSRQAPAEVQRAMTEVARELASMGMCLRSGHAKGSDQAFERGAGGRAEVYLPKTDFERQAPRFDGARYLTYDDVTSMDRDAARASVSRYHPYGRSLRRNYEAAKAMVEAENEGRREEDRMSVEDVRGAFPYLAHRRNYFQVMGSQGAAQSAFVACWTPVRQEQDKRLDKETGMVVEQDNPFHGTDQAIRVARDNNIPVFNAAEYGDSPEDLERWKRDVIDAARRLMTNRLYRDGSADQMLRVDDAIMAINAANYEMFRDLGMDSTAGFLTSEFGRKLLENADRPDVVAGIYASMVYAWKTQRIVRIQNEIREVSAAESPLLSRYMDLRNQARFSMDELSESSLTWEGILKEMRAGRASMRAFAQLQTEEGREDARLDAPDFWSGDNGYASPSDYGGIEDVIKDLDMPWPLKCDIITDVVRWQTQFTGLKSFEVGFEMTVGGNCSYSIDSSAPKSPMQVFRDMESASTRYANKGQLNMELEVQKAAYHWRSKEGRLTNALRRIADCPWERVVISDEMYADGILAVRDKTYAQTEKAKKHPWTNALYAAISLQRNGGYFNDVYRLDDRLLGMQHKSKISAGDIAKVLTDPGYVLTAYDDDGAVGYLTQGLLLGIDHEASESEIWDWLVRNPRIAGVLRQGAASVIADSKSKGYVGSLLSLDETLSQLGADGHRDTMGHVKYLMRDHPVYGGLIALLSPAHGTSVRTERNRIPVIEETVCTELYRAATEGKRAEDVLGNLGITVEGLSDLLTSDFDKYMERMSVRWASGTIEEAEREARSIYDTLVEHIDGTSTRTGYLQEIAANVTLGDPAVRPRMRRTKAEPEIDIESVASFWDTIQELSGSKVGVSTGVEGRETYELSYWVSHMSAKDGYADLEAIESAIGRYKRPEEFDGMWTNKGPLSVSVTTDDRGRSVVTTNIAELRAMKVDERDELITRVPEGFTVPDKSVTSKGTQVPSLYAAMVSKRANGAEKFNLKAMKAGLDGTDSISKMREKYSMVEYDDGSRLPTFSLELRQQLAEVASTQGGIEYARMALANMLMDQDQQMGYKDMTLANYMCLAEVMLVEDEDHEIVLRSLGQLTTALRGRIGARAASMTDEQVSDAVSRIAFDTGDQAVGKLRVWDSNELLSSIRPYGSANDAQSGMKMSSSVFANNLDLLERIMDERRLELNDDQMMDATLAKIRHRKVTREGITGVTSVFDKSEVARNYKVVGWVGEGKVDEVDEGGNPVIRAGDVGETVGPEYMWIIGEGNLHNGEMQYLCDRAYELGLTVLVAGNHVDEVPDEYRADLIPAGSSGHMLLPMFDMRLNGSEARPFEPSFAIFKVPHDRYMISAEDPNNVFDLGDAQYAFTRHAIDRIHVVNSGTETLTATELFPNVFGNEEYMKPEGNSFWVSYADRQTIDDLIVNADTIRCSIDYGVREGDPGFGQRVHDVNQAIERYKRNLQLTTDDKGMGWIQGVDVRPGDIAGWAVLTVTRMTKNEMGENEHRPVEHILAPIIPFPLHGTKTKPEVSRFTQTGIASGDTSLLSVDWGFDREMSEGGYVKVFDSSGGANKGMVNLSRPIEEDLRLKNGMRMDAYCAAQSTDSRKIGTDRRIKSMISLMAIARMQGYNFARIPNTFPENPELQEIANRRVGRDVWGQVLGRLAPEDVIKFVGGSGEDVRRLNAFLTHEVRKIYDNGIGSEGEGGGNPTDYLACVFTDENGNDYNSCVMWEFECMFSNSINYEDCLLRFLHFMDGDLCPDGIEDPSEDHMFRLFPGQLYDRGILQAKVPYPYTDETGRRMVAYVWSNIAVGMSFFGEESSYNSRPNVVGASDMLDSANTRAYYDGVRGLTPRKQSLRAEWATAEEAWPPRDAGGLGALEWLSYE